MYRPTLKMAVFDPMVVGLQPQSELEARVRWTGITRLAEVILDCEQKNSN